MVMVGTALLLAIERSVLCEGDGCILFGCFGFEYGACLLVVFADDDGCVGLDDACLLVGNLGQCVAQESYVVKADVGDDCEVGRDDIGTVESSA